VAGHEKELRDMQTKICRWGILGAAEIARKNWQAIRNASNCTLTAVASRDVDRCRQFIAECQQHAPFAPPPHACATYDELLACDAVDAVYIPLPTGVRKTWAIRAAEAGKHILIEKPVAVSAQDLRDILAACRQSGVQFMDGVMFMHSRRMDRLRSVIDDGQTLGTLTRITSQFSDGEATGEAFGGNIRANAQLEPFGCLGDLGWYTIRFTLWAMKWELPARVSGHILSEYRRPGSPAAVPTDFSAELFFANGVSANFYCSFIAQIQQWANLAGTKGAIDVRDFVLPLNGEEVAFEASNPVFAIRGCDFIMERPTRCFVVPEHSQSHATAQETNMFRRFAELALSGPPDTSWGEIALKTQRVMDACLESARAGGRVIDVPA
jgi:predicted dehydrogenase